MAGTRSLASLTHGYEQLAAQYGIKIIHDVASVIDPVAKTVTLQGGTRLTYDRLVASPGIAFQFDAIDGYDAAASELMPHAWNAGPQTELLRAQLEAMSDGSVFVITVPKTPYRCPPGPYERASLVAHYFKQSKPRSKILILDAKDSFFEQDLFEEGWNRHYPGMIEWLPSQFTGGIRSVDVKDRSITIESETIKAAVVNIIPPQLASTLMQAAGLTDKSGWCPVDPSSFESKLYPGIHVLGDAAVAGDMPKSAASANSQAKVCAVAIGNALTGSERAAPQLSNTCYSYLAEDDAVSDLISFKLVAGALKSDDVTLSQVDDNRQRRLRTAHDAEGWYDAITLDMFG